MKRSALLGALCTAVLTGCVVVVETPPPYGRQNTNVVTYVHRDGDQVTDITAPKASAESPPPLTPPQSTCPPYQLPKAGPEPIMPNLAEDQYKTRKDVETALATYIKQLRKYAKEERRRVDSSYQHWRDTCVPKTTP